MKKKRARCQHGNVNNEIYLTKDERITTIPSTILVFWSISISLPALCDEGDIDADNSDANSTGKAHSFEMCNRSYGDGYSIYKQ